MADKLRSTFPIPVVFSDGELPTATKLTAIGSQAKNGLSVVELALGDLWNQSGDLFFDTLPIDTQELMIPNLARQMGQSKLLNPRIPYLPLIQEYTYYFTNDSGNKAVLTFPAAAASGTPPDDGGTTFDWTGTGAPTGAPQTSAAAVVSSQQWHVNRATGEALFFDTINTDWKLTYKPLIRGEFGPSSTFNVIPDPFTEDVWPFKGLKIEYFNGTNNSQGYKIYLPPRGPLVSERRGLRASPQQAYGIPANTDNHQTDPSAERLFFQDASIDAVFPGVAGAAEIDAENYRYKLPELLTSNWQSSSPIPENLMYLWDAHKTGTLIEGVTFTASSAASPEKYLLVAAGTCLDNWLQENEQGALIYTDTILKNTAHTAATYPSTGLRLITVGTSMSNALSEMSRKLIDFIGAGGEEDLTEVIVDPVPIVVSYDLLTGTGLIGEEIFIVGSNFSATPGNNTVTFSTGKVAGVITATPNQLRVEVPAGTVSGTVSVTTAAGTGVGPVFTPGVPPVIGPPTVSSIVPSSQRAGETLTIFGTNFTSPASSNTVQFQIGQAATVLGGSSTQLSVTVPGGASSGVINVSNVNGAVDSPAFTLLPPTTATSHNDLADYFKAVEQVGLAALLAPASAIANSDQHAQYMHRYGSSRSPTRDIYAGGMLGNLLMNSSTSGNNYQNLSGNSNKIYFGHPTDGPNLGNEAIEFAFRVEFPFGGSYNNFQLYNASGGAKLTIALGPGNTNVSMSSLGTLAIQGQNEVSLRGISGDLTVSALGGERKEISNDWRWNYAGTSITHEKKLFLRDSDKTFSTYYAHGGFNTDTSSNTKPTNRDGFEIGYVNTGFELHGIKSFVHRDHDDMHVVRLGEITDNADFGDYVEFRTISPAGARAWDIRSAKLKCIQRTEDIVMPMSFLGYSNAGGTGTADPTSKSVDFVSPFEDMFTMTMRHKDKFSMYFTVPVWPQRMKLNTAHLWVYTVNQRSIQIFLSRGDYDTPFAIPSTDASFSAASTGWREERVPNSGPLIKSAIGWDRGDSALQVQVEFEFTTAPSVLDQVCSVKPFIKLNVTYDNVALWPGLGED